MIDIYKYSDKEITEILKTAMIVVDTREQKNKHITKWFDDNNIKWCNEKLDYGDYTIKFLHLGTGREVHLQDICVVERKANLEELSGNLTHNRDRFNSEFLRAKGKIYLLIENADYGDIREISRTRDSQGNIVRVNVYNTQFDAKSFRASLDSFEHTYNLHVHYMKNIEDSGQFIYRTLIAALRKLLKEGII